MSQKTDASKDAALRAVGRTVVNFQRLEHGLKLAAQLGPVQGTFQKIQRDFEKRRERAQSLTLGQAIQSWLSCLEGGPVQPVWTPDLFDISVRMTFELEADNELADSHAQILSALLEIRNALVHTRLAMFPWDSPDSCQELVTELDSVNTRIVEQIDYVASLLQKVGMAQKEHAEALVAAISEAFEKRLSRVPVEANIHKR